MLYSQSVKNLVSGISQQAPVQRYPEQLEEQINGLSTESSGLQKRPPTIFVHTLMPALEGEALPLIHFIDRDENEKYLVYFYNKQVFVYDLNGIQHTVSYANDQDYLSTNTPRDSLRVVTIADHTFIVNKEKIIKMRADRSANVFDTQGALIAVKQGQYGRTYVIWVDGRQVASYQTPDGSDKSHTSQIDTQNIVRQLVTQCRNNGCTVDEGDSWLRIKNVHSVKTQDGFNNQAMTGVVDVVQRFNLLPSSAPDNFTVKVQTDPNGEEAGSYYVRYNATDKVWEETLQPNLQLGFDFSTMPHELIRQADGTFLFQRVNWKDREVGDNDSNPLPSFIDFNINDIFFYRNRLGFLSGENVILSESGEYFNFWMTTASDILDIDPIDVTTTTDRINILNYAVPFAGDLYCFSDKSQFALRSDTTLSPRNCALVEMTGFQSSADCRPVRSGRNLYFAAKRAEYTSIKEYYSVQQTSEEKNAQDITAHVPDYIPNGVFQIEAGNNENILLVLTQGSSNCIYVYKYLFMNEQRVQASWSHWDMGTEVFGVFFVGSTLYLVLNRGKVHTLEKMNFTTSSSEDFPDIESYRIYLDCKKISTQGVYDEVFENTTFDLVDEYDLASAADIKHVGIVTSDNTYIEFTADEIKDGKVKVKGDYSTKNIIIGIPYTFHIKLSTIYMRSQDSQGNSRAILNGRLQLRNIHINYADTGGFTVKVAKLTDADHVYAYKMTSRFLGTNTARIGTIPDSTGSFKVPLQTLNTSCEILIESDTTYPLSLISYLWEATWVQRSKGV